MKSVSELIGHPWACRCGRTHVCPIRSVTVAPGALQKLSGLVRDSRHVLLVADDNTWPIAGDKAARLTGERLERAHIFHREGALVPDEAAVSELESAVSNETDLIIGVGSGVVNDLCKFVSFRRGLEYVIVATAPSMDGYASSGAAMIERGMKVTHTTHPPRDILADTDILAAAPMDMIRSGYGDIIGKFSSLNDWRLSELVNGEYLCPEIYDLVMETTVRVRSSADRIARRDPEAIAALTEALILIGVTLSLVQTTRPGSGSEHHLSHFFEIVGLIRHERHLLHGTDVGFATVETARLRETIAALPSPAFHPLSMAQREAAWERIYGEYADEVRALQSRAGFYERDFQSLYRSRWDDIRAVVGACPTAGEIWRMLQDVGFRWEDFTGLYGQKKIDDGLLFGKDLKERYSVLWINYELFSGADGHF